MGGRKREGNVIRVCCYRKKKRKKNERKKKNKLRQNCVGSLKTKIYLFLVRNSTKYGFSRLKNFEVSKMVCVRKKKKKEKRVIRRERFIRV